MKYEKTAKDLAFDRERQKYRTRIAKLEEELEQKKLEIIGLENERDILKDEV